MFDFLSRGRSKSNSPSSTGRPPPPASAPASAPPRAAQREMVRLALHTVLRNKGIPGNWMTCEVTPIHIPGQGEAVLVQLIVLKWHDALMQYAPALQQSLIEGLKHFDASATAAKYHFGWTYSQECGFPNNQFPESSFWNSTSTSSPSAVNPSWPSSAPAQLRPDVPAPTPTKPKFDLPLTAADLRGQQDDDDDDDHGFAATQVNSV